MPTQQQSPLLLVNDQNASVLQYLGAGLAQPIAYSPFGYHVHTGADPISAFNGQACESLAGAYLLGNGYRAYSVVQQRFYSPDDLSPFGEGGTNTYTYCMGDPLNKVDPSGHAGVYAKILRKSRPTSTFIKSRHLHTTSLPIGPRKISTIAEEASSSARYIGKLNQENLSIHTRTTAQLTPEINPRTLTWLQDQKQYSNVQQLKVPARASIAQLAPAPPDSVAKTASSTINLPWNSKLHTPTSSRTPPTSTNSASARQQLADEVSAIRRQDIMQDRK